MKLVEEYKFPSLFINQFFPRPGTPAAKMPRIPAQLVRFILEVLELFKNVKRTQLFACNRENVTDKCTGIYLSCSHY